MMDAEDIIRNSCTFRKIEKTKNPTVTGQIKNVLPLIKKSRKQQRSVLILHCQDVSPGESNSFHKFKILFFDEIAERLWSWKPTYNDYVAVRRAVPAKDSAYSNSDLFYENLLFVKSPSNCLKRVFFRKNKKGWISLESIVSGNRIQHKERTRGRVLVSSCNGVRSRNQNKSNNVDVEVISSTDWLMAKKTALSRSSNEAYRGRAETSTAGPSNKGLTGWLKTAVSGQSSPNESFRGRAGTSTASPQNKNLDPTSPSKKTTSPFKAPLAIRSPQSLMQGIVRCQQLQSNDRNISTRNAMSQLKCVYTKLAALRENMVVNTVAIIRTVPEVPIKGPLNKFCLYIYVVDDTNPDGFKIRIFYNREEDCPILRRYFLILCQEMKITRIKNELCGTIIYSRQIATFDRDDPKICYTNSSELVITPEDEERVEWLRKWMFEKIPTSRPFTPLASIINKNDTINLRCEIVDVKDYDKNIIVLRVKDGTTCEVPFLRVPFESDSWQNALAEMKSNREPSKEIDIIVHVRFDHQYKKLKLELKPGFIVKLFNVSLNLVPDVVKTKPGNSLKAYLEGDSDNIKVIRKKGRTSYTNSPNQTSAPKIVQSKSPSAISGTTNKRKLFDHSPRNESVDSDDTDFEKSLETVSPKKSKLVVTPKKNTLVVSPRKNTSAVSPKKSDAVTFAKTCDPILVGPSTSSASLTRAKNPNTNMIQNVHVLSNDNQPASSTIRSDKEPAVLANTNSSVVVQGSHSSGLAPCISRMESQDSISLARIAREKAAAKAVRGHLHQSIKSVLAVERQAVQKRVTDYTAINDVSNYLVQWPSDPGENAFFIQVTIMSTIPFINGSSSDFELLALISGYCKRCDRFFPFYLAKWIVSDDDGPVSICPKCKEQDVMSSLKHELVCELLLNDEFGVSMPGVVLSHHAENFFGCSVSQLCSSVEAKIRVRTFIDSHVFTKGKEKRPLIVKVIRIYSAKDNAYKYHILS